MTTQAIAATLFGPGDLRVVEHRLGPLAPGMVRVRFRAGGICGSDLHYFRHARTGDFAVNAPLILGHEISGDVLEINGVAPGLEVGDRVAVNPSRWCGHCARCQEGRANLCENIYFMGSASKSPHMQGGFVTIFDATPAQCVRVEEHVSYQAAALAEPLAVSLHAVGRAGELGRRNVIIFGAGPIGLLILLAARLKACDQVAVVDIAQEPLAFANRLGAERTIDVAGGDAELTETAAETPFDIAFEVSGTAAGLSAAITSVRRGGTIIQVGNLPGGMIAVPANAVMSKEIDLRGTFRFGMEFNQAVQLISAGRIDVLNLVTGERSLSIAADAFHLAADRSRSVKVMLTAN